MKLVYFQYALLCLVYINISYAMDVHQQPDASTKYVQVQAHVPLGPTATIEKQANLQVPSKLLATIQKQRQSEEEILTAYIKQRTPELTKMLGVFVGLMQNNCTGQPLQLGTYDATLFSLLKAPQTSFFYLCDNRLIIDWHLGDHDGWRLNHNVTIQYVPNHPRKGTRSDAMVEFENRTKNKHFAVPFSQLVTLYEKAGQKRTINQKTVLKLIETVASVDEFTKLHAADIVALARYYIDNHAK